MDPDKVNFSQVSKSMMKTPQSALSPSRDPSVKIRRGSRGSVTVKMRGLIAEKTAHNIPFKRMMHHCRRWLAIAIREYSRAWVSEQIPKQIRLQSSEGHARTWQFASHWHSPPVSLASDLMRSRRLTQATSNLAFPRTLIVLPFKGLPHLSTRPDGHSMYDGGDTMAKVPVSSGSGRSSVPGTG